MALDMNNYQKRDPRDEIKIMEIAELLLAAAAPSVHFDGRHRVTLEDRDSLETLKQYIRDNGASTPANREESLKKFHDTKHYKDFGLDGLAKSVGVTLNGGKIQHPPLSEKFSGPYANKVESTKDHVR